MRQDKTHQSGFNDFLCDARLHQQVEGADWNEIAQFGPEGVGFGHGLNGRREIPVLEEHFHQITQHDTRPPDEKVKQMSNPMLPWLILDNTQL